MHRPCDCLRMVVQESMVCYRGTTITLGGCEDVDTNEGVSIRFARTSRSCRRVRLEGTGVVPRYLGLDFGRLVFAHNWSISPILSTGTLLKSLHRCKSNASARECSPTNVIIRPTTQVSHETLFFLDRQAWEIRQAHQLCTASAVNLSPQTGVRTPLPKNCDQAKSPD